jgi:hypothetical protein
VLQLITKTSPDAFDFDETAWFPTVYAVKPPAGSGTPPADVAGEKKAVDGKPASLVSAEGPKTAGAEGRVDASVSGKSPDNTPSASKASSR